MNKSEQIAMLSSFSNTPGAPGFEADVSKLASSYLKDLGQLTQDKMHNLYLSREENSFQLDQTADRKQAGRLCVQLDAHQDEVAFMVSAIRENGTLEFINLGGWVTSNIPAHLVKVMTRDGSYVTGLTTSKPPHFMTDAEKAAALKLEDVVIDVGSKSLEDTLKLGIEVGLPVIPDVEARYMEDQDILLGKAFDCRAGCSAIVNVMRGLAGQKLDVDVVAALSTQEEVGTRGAQVTANRVKPDLAIVFEGCPADDTFTPAYKAQTCLGKGPMLRHIDARMVTHPGFQRYALDLAAEHNIPCQRAVRSGGSTNGAPIHLSNQGVPTIVIGIPVRYIHTSYGMLSLGDFQASVDLATAILRSMNADVYDQL
ncbi:MAG: M42 family peptidase [Eubacteriales bacterium]|nr:M42 family peptidase [Clostridiales bacterium]MDY5835861.1 M42 family peptidase [Eubacteriales bacterium]